MVIRKILAEYIRRWKQFLRIVSSDFRPALYSFFIILIPSTLLLPLTYLAPSVADMFHSSRLTPWGVFTSIWIHYDFEHYAGNMFAILLFVFVFAIVHKYDSVDERLRSSRVLMWNPVVSAIGSNVYTLIVLPLSSAAGASGAAFAYLGICFAYAVLNVHLSSFKPKQLREHLLQPRNRATAITGLGILAMFFLLFYLNPVPAHFTGFLAGFSLTGIYETVYSSRIVVTSQLTQVDSPLSLLGTRNPDMLYQKKDRESRSAISSSVLPGEKGNLSSSSMHLIRNPSLVVRGHPMVSKDIAVVVEPRSVFDQSTCGISLRGEGPSQCGIV